jgi:hypothetical protein
MSTPNRPARWGLAASLTLSSALVGCSTETDKAMVTVTEPSANASASTSSTAPVVPTSSTTSAESKTPEAKAAPVGETAAGWGTLKGRVVFSGDPPPKKVLVPKGDSAVKDAAVCAKEEIDSQKLVVDPASKGVRYAIVYIPKPTSVNKEAASAAKTAQIVFDQKNCTFVPHVLAAMKGATVEIKSSDPVGHNANAVGLNNNKFNLPTQPLSSQPYPLKGVDRPGKVGCDIHSWMEAYWLVLDNPYFAVTDEKGNFEIKDAPAGDQKVVVWAEALGPGYLTSPSGDVVNIKAGGDTTKDFTLDASKVK